MGHINLVSTDRLASAEKGKTKANLSPGLIEQPTMKVYGGVAI